MVPQCIYGKLNLNCWPDIYAETIICHHRMVTSSNGNIFRITGPLCGESTGLGEFPTQRPVTQSFDVFFDMRLNKRLSKHSRCWWFETPSWSLWRQCNGACTWSTTWQTQATGWHIVDHKIRLAFLMIYLALSIYISKSISCILFHCLIPVRNQSWFSFF